MKKTISLICLALFAGSISLFALSYDNNEYQRKSRAYDSLAQKAFNEGDYDLALKYSNLSKQNAEESAAFIKRMLIKNEAQNAMNRARTRFAWAKNNKAETLYPTEYAEADKALQAGTLAFNNENYDESMTFAQKVLDALKNIKGAENEFAVLPAQFRVRTWRLERDCLWNIAGLDSVYGDPFMWKKLYEANKHKLPEPSNPDLVEPGIMLDIPSIRGEKRSGNYDSGKTYQSLPKK